MRGSRPFSLLILVASAEFGGPVGSTRVAPTTGLRPSPGWRMRLRSGATRSDARVRKRAGSGR